MVNGFFFRAIRICREGFLADESAYISEAFRKLRYPLGTMNKLKRKTQVIFEKRSNV